ncbi:MAG: sensor histidine kinase [Planctomycetota bacterium]
MTTTSLRLRLILAFSILVGLVLFVGFVSYGVNEQVRTDVAELRPTKLVDVSGVDFERQGLEFEGYWNPAGAFVATQVTEEPEPLRPKLRGELQAVSAAERTVTMYGRVIRITDGTDGDEDDTGHRLPLDFGELQPGRRAEISCRVDETSGEWSASKIELRNVKSSDKVKGMVRPVDLDGVPPESVDMAGLTIVVQAIKENGPENAFTRIEHATEMLRALQKCRAAAHEALVLFDADPDPDADPAERQQLMTAAAVEMDREAARFEQILADARYGGGNPSAVPSGDFRNYLGTLRANVPGLVGYIREMQALVQRGRSEQALQYLSAQMEPYLDHELLPYVYSYLNKAEEELGDELRGVLDRTQTTTRVALGTSVVAVLVAVVLGLMVWQSIQRPIRQLHDAALALGQGRLDTRVQVRRRDELGVLGAAFNSMASQLAASTVSVASLEAMFDSMAAGVILCDREARITNANRAARQLVGRESDALVGQPLEFVCRLGDGERAADLATNSREAGGSLERAFVRADGTEFPASISCAGLRTADGGLQGFVVVAQDLTPIKQIEEQLRESLAEKELLLREVHHRVKNNMQVISSLLAMQSTHGDPEVLRRLEESQNRIRTIALIHEQLYQSTELAHIDTRSYLNVLATHLLQSYGRADSIDLQQEVEDLSLDLDQSLACGLIVNELLTNSLKYAFPDGRRGTIRLVLRQQTDGTRLLEVSDDGRGPIESAAPQKRKTLGTSLVAKLARQLRGKVTIDGNGGMTTRIVFAGRAPAEAVTT